MMNYSFFYYQIWTFKPLNNEVEKNFENSTRKFVEDCLNGAVNGKIVSQEEILSKYVYNETLAMLRDLDLMKKIKSFKFDLAVMDGVILSRYHHIIPYYFGIPFVTVTNFVSDPAFRLLALPSYCPSLLSPYTEIMNFHQRLHNLLIDVCLRNDFLRQFLLPSEDVNLLRDYLPGTGINSWGELTARSKLLIVLRGTPIQYPTPLWPNIIQVYGLTLKPNDTSKLPEHIESILNKNERKKIVLVSFGSFGGLFPSSLAKLFLESFGEMKNLYFIWSVKLDYPVVLPSNVKLFNWLPQKDLLADERIVMFISHAGHNSQAESLFYGKPILCIPIFGDQEHNANKIKYYGYGNFIHLYKLTKEALMEKINEIIHNKTMKINIKKIEKFAKQQSEIDMKNLMINIEKLLLFGDNYLKSYGQNIPIYQYYLIDILFFLLFLFILIIFIIFILLKIFLNCLFAKRLYNQFNKKNN